MEIFWPNVHICSRQQGRRQQRRRQVNGTFHSDNAGDRTPLSTTSAPWPPFLPRREGEQEAQTPRPHAMQQLNTNLPCRTPFPPGCVPIHGAPEHSPHTHGSSCPAWFWQKHQSLQKTLNGSHPSQHLLFCRDVQIRENRKG